MAVEDNAKAKEDARRDFLKMVGKAGIATPAVVTLMLSAGTKSAQAGIHYVD